MPSLVLDLQCECVTRQQITCTVCRRLCERKKIDLQFPLHLVSHNLQFSVGTIILVKQKFLYAWSPPTLKSLSARLIVTSLSLSYIPPEWAFSLRYWVTWRHGTRGSHSYRQPARRGCPAAAPCSASECAAAAPPVQRDKYKFTEKLQTLQKLNETHLYHCL